MCVTMFLCILVLFFYGTSTSLTAVVKDLNEISAVSVNDRIFHDRWKRQTQQCRIGQWQCRDGTCIGIDGKCDGAIDCPDRSDETHALCRKIKCQPNWFRCTYGACVDGTAPCNGIVDCADQSDELLPKCRNETDVTLGRFKCQDGNFIPALDYCDGVPDCPDGSDETVRACAAKKCQNNLFQCAYGACVDQKADCNGQKECIDGSDESEELCSKQTYRPPTNSWTPTIRPLPGKCVLPAYPVNGKYVVTNAPYATPGQTFQSVRLNVTCDPGYGVVDNNEVFCQDGRWSEKNIPQCILFCKLDPHPSVTHQCLVSDGNVKGWRNCSGFEPSGTIIRPECRPNYYSPINLLYMRCNDGVWSSNAVCSPECGRLTPDGTDLIIDGRYALRGELPWHVGIYRKNRVPGKQPKQICGGSLVSNAVVISAAHCFWDAVGLQQPAENYAVAIAKLYRKWNSEVDKDAQKSDVKAIHLPVRFQGKETHFQEDIAVVILESPFTYRHYVRPVCLDFTPDFHNKQLVADNLGKVAGWGYTEERGRKPSELLKVVNLPYVDIPKCQRILPKSFKEYLTGDKICAGYKNGTALCKGDSGGGLAFPETVHGVERYFLRGVASTAPTGDADCNAYELTAFTEIIRHQYFIEQFL